MNIWLLIIAGIAGIIVGRKLAHYTKMRKRRLSPRDMIKEKEAAKRMIMAMLREKKRLTNDDVEELARVSDATATRYLDELEKEGKIKQIGTGKGTYYELK